MTIKTRKINPTERVDDPRYPVCCLTPPDHEFRTDFNPWIFLQKNPRVGPESELDL